MAERHEVLNLLEADMRRMLTIEPDGRISVQTDKDVDLLLRIARESPEVLQSRQSILTGDALALQQMMLDRIQAYSSLPTAPTNAASTPEKLPPNPLRMSQAREQYREACANANLAEKTVFEREKLLKRLTAHIAKTVPDMGDDPFVHEIGTHHLSSFLDSTTKKATTRGEATQSSAAPSTVIKKISSLRSFFLWAFEERDAALLDPTTGLDKRDKNLRKAATKVKRHYQPFSTAELTTIFDPHRYLEFNSQADYFWAPLLGLHLGTRLKEIITLSVADIALHDATGIWFMDVRPENAKNPNSIRRLPIPARLMELGFIDYVERLRGMGATSLFPHRDLTSKTARRDPSKNTSRAFGEYLDSIGIVDRDLVFHSFRHTVVTALQNAGTPLKDSMEIAGHQAQEHAVRTGRITAEQAQSVHLKVYTHADKEALDATYPLARLRRHLDIAIVVPLNYERLKKAATIVAEHVRRSADGYTSGWSLLGRNYVDEQLGRL